MAGYWNKSDGYGLSCSLLAKELLSKEWDIRPVWKDGKDSIQFSLPEVMSRKDLKPDSEVALAFCMTPDLSMLPIPVKRLLLFFLWESTEYPATWGCLLNFVDAIVTPSTFCGEVARKAGATCPIFVVGLPLGTSTFPPPPKERTIDGEFKILFVSSAYERKGWDLAVVAFEKAFPNGGAHLHMHIPNLGSPHWIRDKCKENQNISFSCMYLPSHRILELYHRHHCLLHPARGEGFARTVAEAMLTELPVIAPPETGMKDFVSDKTAFPVKTSRWRPCNHPFYTTGMWAEPDMDSIVEGLHWTRDNYCESKVRAKQGRNLILEKYGDGACVQRVEYLLQNAHRLGVDPSIVHDYEKSFGGDGVTTVEDTVGEYFDE